MLLHGDCLSELKKLSDCSVDSLVTDPPAGISFMGKDWDDDKGGREQWVAWMMEVMTECLRVLKPGAHGLVWAIPRTSHWTATALENAGFEIRDVVTHLFGTGFPKSMDISKAIDNAAGAERVAVGPHPNARKTLGTVNICKKDGDGMLRNIPATEAAKRWQGFGTALKPASEHWILVRKPCSEKTVASNVLKWGTGALNIDASRISTSEDEQAELNRPNKRPGSGASGFMTSTKREFTAVQGRFPANLVLDEEAAAALDEQSGISPAKPGRTGRKGGNNGALGAFGGSTADAIGHWPADSGGGASRFFYVAKASKKDKGEGNTHPTVKSTELMSYLCKLVTPPNGIVLDPFTGSGSTGVAAKSLGLEFIGIEKNSEYLEIARKRIG